MTFNTMTKQEAIDKLVSDYRAEGFRDFFTAEVERLAGDGNIITNAMYDDIIRYFHNFT